MDFRVKKLILEEGMKNIAETEGVKLEMEVDDYYKKIKVDFTFTPAFSYGFGCTHVNKECSYDDLADKRGDVFKTIEDTRREVRGMKNPIAIGFKNGIHGGFTYSVNIDASKSSKLPKIKNVIFNYPATIVFWKDGDKTVVKCQGDDIYDPEKGLAMAIVKKAYGNKGNYCEIFKPWCEKYEKERMEAFYKEQDELMKRGAQKFVKEPLTEEDIIAEAPIDIQDILEDKVDPLMIKVDDEPTEKRCIACKHEGKPYDIEPCEECLIDVDGKLPKWEPKD